MDYGKEAIAVYFKGIIHTPSLHEKCHLLITFANSLDSDQAWRNFGPDLGSKLFDPDDIYLKESSEKNSADNKEACKFSQHARSYALI